MEEQQVGPTVPGRRLELISNGKPQIDGRLRQNPAYRPARFHMGDRREILLSPKLFWGKKFYFSEKNEENLLTTNRSFGKLLRPHQRGS